MQSLVESLDVSQASTKAVEIPQTILAEDLGDIEEQASALVLDFVAAEDFDHLAALVDALLVLSQHDKCAAGTSHLALETALETLSVENVAKFWPYIETRWLRLANGVEPNRGPGITLLRTLKALRHRLSPVSDSQLMVAVMNHMSESFAFPARATVNSKSISVAPPIPEWDRSDTDTTYQLFWQTMVDLRDVRALYTSSELVSEHLQRLRELAKVFRSADRDNTEPVQDLIWNTDPLVLPGLINSKSVQRVVALQVMIAIEGLLEQRKSEHDRLVASSSNRGALDDFILSPEQEKEVLQLKSAWFSVLREACARSQLQYIQKFFMGEKDWTLWKHANTPGSFPPLANVEIASSEPENPLPTPTPQAQYPLVTAKLTELWQVKPSLDSAFSSLQQSTDTDYVARYKVAAEEDPENKYIYRWLALNNTHDAEKTAAEVGADYLEPGAAGDLIDELQQSVDESPRGEKRSHPDESGDEEEEDEADDAAELEEEPEPEDERAGSIGAAESESESEPRKEPAKEAPQ